MAYVYREYRSKRKPWCIAYKGADGRMHREKTDAPTKELAKKLLSKRLVEVTEAKVAGITTHQPSITFNEFMKEYYKHIEAKKTEKSCIRDKGSIAFLAKVFGERKLKEIRIGQIQKYVDDRMHQRKKNGKPYKPATINRELMCLSGIFREAVKRGYVDRHPVRGIKQLPEDNCIVRYLDVDEEKALLDAATPSMRPVIIAALNSGMRRGELLKLEWQDVDLEQRLIHVRLTKSKRNRYIPMNAVLYELLKKQPKYKDCSYVFANPETREKWFDLNRAWNTTLRHSGVKNFRFHDLRHTFASRLVQAGVPIKAVQELLGHASLQVTMRYAHLSPADLRRAVDILGAEKSATHPATQVPSSEGSEKAEDGSPSPSTGKWYPREDSNLRPSD